MKWNIFNCCLTAILLGVCICLLVKNILIEDMTLIVLNVISIAALSLSLYFRASLLRDEIVQAQNIRKYYIELESRYGDEDARSCNDIVYITDGKLYRYYDNKSFDRAALLIDCVYETCRLVDEYDEIETLSSDNDRYEVFCLDVFDLMTQAYIVARMMLFDHDGKFTDEFLMKMNDVDNLKIWVLDEVVAFPIKIAVRG